MPTQTVIEKLKDLQAELETVAAAVKHIDQASKVAKTTSEILKKLPDLINDLKALEEKHRQELLKVHKDKIDVLEKQLQNLLTEFKEKSKQLTQLIDETNKLVKTISDYHSEIKKINFPERLNKIDNQISAINIGVGNLQTAIQNTQKKVDIVLSSVNTLGQIIDMKLSDLENKFVAENLFLKKEIKTSRIIAISVGGILLIGIALILILCHN
jgi:chromosome segregation ATPase